MDEKFKIQDSQYLMPYHHLVDFDSFNNCWVMPWGEEYFSYSKKALNLLFSYNPKSVIDIGCGDGKISFEISKKKEININVGVDLSEKAIMFAKAMNYNNGAIFYCSDISNISGVFDSAMLIEVMEHIPDIEIKEFINKVRDKLSNGGVLIVSVPSDILPVNSKHYRHYNDELLSKHLNGFKLDKLFYISKTGLLSVFLNKLIRKFASIKILRIFLFNIYEHFFSEGNKNSHRHIVASYIKK